MSVDGRDFLKDSIRKRIDFSRTPQNRGEKPPPPQIPVIPGARRIDLPRPGEWTSIPDLGVRTAIGRRRSRRKFTRESLSLEDLAFLLWATQGLRPDDAGQGNFRTVPSAGCRHAFETYVLAFRVEGLDPAVYRYLPFGHALVETGRRNGMEELLTKAAFNQRFCGESAAAFVWTAIPARMEWRYIEAAYKVMALDAGHICQNLYLACENIAAGTCAVAAYDQDLMDELLGIDGQDEFTVYLAPVGKIPKE
ncbi:MAG: SagB/ThcOx family dehydrogenase [Candidatus Aminicenantes bacterium]|nr:SagB/ThcOx family dehydrogenase [Candidatus Aminicenantes bacterium]